MTDDDWAPLPPEQQGRHPGEVVDLQKRNGERSVPPSTSASTPAAAPAPRRRDPAAEAEAARVLAELKNKLAQSAPAKSLIAEAQHRQLREERKKKNVQAAVVRALGHHPAKIAEPNPADSWPLPPVEPAAEAPVESAPEAAPAVTAEEAEAADIDPREKEPWFLELPKKEQERLRTHWWYERHRHDDAGVKLRRRLGRAVGYGAGLFFVMSLLLVMLLGSFAYIPILTAAGGLGAGVAELLGGGRFRYGAAGALAFVLVLGPGVLLQPFSMMALMLLTYGMATLGMDGEMRKTGGFGDG